MRSRSLLLLALGVSMSPALQATEPNTLSQSEELSGWQLLFDGKSIDHWRNYKKDSVGDGWVVEEGALIRKSGGAGDIITKEQYGAFEISLDWKISQGGNSGLMFHVTEEGKTPWQTGPEIQIQDNVDGHDPQKAGWLYQLYPPGKDRVTGETLDATRPAGEWNQMHVRITPGGCEINMNGVRYARFKKGSEDWNKKVAASKFSKFEQFGKPEKGHICLQDHGNEVAFRNIKIRDLSDPVPNPVTNVLPFKTVTAFPNLKWDGWQPVDDRGRPQAFRPIVVTHAGDGSNRLFVAEQHGQVYSLIPSPDVTESTRVLDISDRVIYNDRQNEEGLLGLAFHPQFKENGKAYVYYTAKPGRVSIISEFSTANDDSGKLDPASEREIMRLEQPYWNHNGGTICFGPDGYLYVGLGDGGSANDPHGNAQNLNVLLGSILRIDIDKQENGKAYGIPADNPFVGRDDAQPEIYAYGLRNVWRMSFDDDGKLWCADVGQNLWEEVNLIEKGGNYGWNYMEASKPFGSRVPPTDANFIDPIWEYDHGVGKSVTGGLAVHRSQHILLRGSYIYADYVSGKLWSLSLDEVKGAFNRSIPSVNLPVITFGEDESHEIYICVVSADGKGIYRLERVATAPN